ncbi:hypothetical protein N8642_02555 [bacterium]|nr:hypothetical protein [bacterium]
MKLYLQSMLLLVALSAISSLQAQYCFPYTWTIPEGVMDFPCPEFHPPVPANPITATIVSATMPVVPRGNDPVLRVELDAPKGIYFFQFSASISNPQWETVKRYTKTPLFESASPYYYQVKLPISVVWITLTENYFEDFALSFGDAGYFRWVYFSNEEILEWVSKIYYTEDPAYRVSCCGGLIKHWLGAVKNVELRDAYDIDPASIPEIGSTKAEQLGLEMGAGGLNSDFYTDAFRLRFPAPPKEEQKPRVIIPPRPPLDH